MKSNIFKNVIASVRFFIKEGQSIIFIILGSLWILKLICLNKRVLVVLNYHNFSKYNNYKIKKGNILETG